MRSCHLAAYDSHGWPKHQPSARWLPPNLQGLAKQLNFTQWSLTSIWLSATHASLARLQERTLAGSAGRGWLRVAPAPPQKPDCVCTKHAGHASCPPHHGERSAAPWHPHMLAWAKGRLGPGSWALSCRCCSWHMSEPTCLAAPELGSCHRLPSLCGCHHLRATRRK